MLKTSPLTRRHPEDALSDPPEDVGQPVRDGAGEGALLEGREVVLGRAADGHAEVAEGHAHAGQGGAHLGGRARRRGTPTGSGPTDTSPM